MRLFWITPLLGISFAQLDPYNTNTLSENQNNVNDNSQIYNLNNPSSNYNPSFNYPDYNQNNYNQGSNFNQNYNPNNFNREVVSHNNNPTYNPNTNYPVYGYGGNSYGNDELTCPQYWIRFQNNCYRFVKSPLRAYIEARKICQVSQI